LDPARLITTNGADRHATRSCLILINRAQIVVKGARALP
jgi:hypothetical protein